MDILFHSPVKSLFPKALESWFALRQHNFRVSYFFNSKGLYPKEEIYQCLTDKLRLARELCLKENYDYLFSVDADIVLPENALELLIKRNKDIISGLWRLRPSRVQNSCLCARVAYQMPDKTIHWRFITKGPDFSPGEMIEAAAIGTSCLLISREALKKIRFISAKEGSLAKEAKDNGFKLFVDTGVECIHLEPTGKEIKI